MAWVSKRRGDLLAVAVLALVTLVIFWRFIFTPYDAIHGDTAYLYQPYYELAANEVQAGRLPLWNPYILMGVPFHASLQPALFYPLRWPMFFMDYVPGLVFTLCLHYFLGALGAYVMIRACLRTGPLAATLGALSIVFGGFAQGHMSHPNYFLSYPWLFGAVTCLWLGMQRGHWRWTIGAGACIGLMGLVGSAHLLLIMGVLLGTMAVYYTAQAVVARIRNRGRSVAILLPLGSMLAAIVLGGAIAAIQLLPAQKLTQQSVRRDVGENPTARQAQFNYITNGSAHPGRTLLQMVVPFRYGDMRLGYWGEISHDEMAHYTGIVMLLLAAVGLCTLRRDRDRWLLVVLGVVGFLLGSGKYLPIYEIVYDLVPPFRQLRFPTRIWWCADIAIACLGALGIQRLQEGVTDAKERSRARWLVPAIAALVVLAVTVSLVQLGSLHGASDEQYEKMVLEMSSKDSWTPTRVQGARSAVDGIFSGDPAAWGGVAVAIASAALITLVVLRGRPMGKKIAAAAGVLLVVDLFCLSCGMVQFAQQYYLTRGLPPRAEFLQKNLGTQRYAVFNADPRPSADDQIQPNRGMQFGVRFLQGTGGGIVDSDERNQFIGLATNPLREQSPWRMMQVLADIAGVKYFFVEPRLKEMLAGMRLAPATKDNRYEVYENLSPLPPAWFVDKLAVATGEQAYAVMYSPQFDPRRMAVVSERPAQAPAAGEKKVLKTEMVPGLWKIETEGDAGQLVVSEGYAPGWRAAIDGADAKVYQTDAQVMSVAVPAGKHAVELRYAPAEFRTGAWITAIASLLTLLGAVALRFVPTPAPAPMPVEKPAKEHPNKPSQKRRS